MNQTGTIGISDELFRTALANRETVALETRHIVNVLLERLGRRRSDVQIAAAVTAVAHGILADWALHPEHTSWPPEAPQTVSLDGLSAAPSTGCPLVCLCQNTYYSAAEYDDCMQRHVADLTPRDHEPALDAGYQAMLRQAQGERARIDRADFAEGLRVYLRERIKR